jgi:hypothetical protein
MGFPEALIIFLVWTGMVFSLGYLLGERRSKR